MTSLEIKLDCLWSQIVKTRAPYCEISGVTYNLEAHHALGRNQKAFRWDPDYGITLTSEIHAIATNDKARFAEMLRTSRMKKYDPARYQKLMAAFDVRPKAAKVYDLKSIKSMLTGWYEHLQDTMWMEADVVPYGYAGYQSSDNRYQVEVI